MDAKRNIYMIKDPQELGKVKHLGGYPSDSAVGHHMRM